MKIKWPNDILVNDKKLCGILIENTLSGDTIHCSVVGIGLNVNQEVFGNEAGTATSLKIISGKEVELKELIEKLCSCLEIRYLQLRSGKIDILDSAYLKSLYRINEWSNYSISENKVEGKILGVTTIPAFFINDIRFEKEPTYKNLKAHIESLLLTKKSKAKSPALPIAVKRIA